MDKITKEGMDLVNDGMNTAKEYFYHAITTIDEKFGEGFAKKHPELIGAFMQTSAKEYNTCFTVQAIQYLTEAIEKSASKITDTFTTNE